MTEQETITIKVNRQIAQDVAELINVCMFRGLIDENLWNRLSELRAQLLFTPNDMQF